MLEKEYKIQVGVYKVKTFRTTQWQKSCERLKYDEYIRLFGGISQLK